MKNGADHTNDRRNPSLGSMLWIPFSFCIAHQNDERALFHFALRVIFCCVRVGREYPGSRVPISYSKDFLTDNSTVFTLYYLSSSIQYICYLLSTCTICCLLCLMYSLMFSTYCFLFAICYSPFAMCYLLPIIGH